MNLDLFLNIALALVFVGLVFTLVFKFGFKRLVIDVETFPTYIQLSYKVGFNKGTARLTASSNYHTPTISKNFSFFNFIIPINCSSEDFIYFLKKMEVPAMYDDKGKEALEILRALLLGYFTKDLHKFPILLEKVNYLRMLKAIRKNRKLLNKFTANLSKPDLSNIPNKVSSIRPLFLRQAV